MDSYSRRWSGWRSTSYSPRTVRPEKINGLSGPSGSTVATPVSVKRLRNEIAAGVCNLLAGEFLFPYSLLGQVDVEVLTHEILPSMFLRRSKIISRLRDKFAV